MVSTAARAQVIVRRYNGSRACDVVVAVRGQELVLRCRDYEQAVKWARIESKSYKIPDDFHVELITAPTQGLDSAP